MYQLPIEQKRYLLQNHLRSSALSKSPGAKTAVKHNAQASTYGPTSAAAFLPKLVPQLTGDSGLMKRFSISSWTSVPVPASPASSTGEFSKADVQSESRRRDSVASARSLSEKQPNISPIQPQSTGWSSWWASSGGEKASSSGDFWLPEEIEKSAKWYVDGIRKKAMDMKLVKHLISLRVHLSTAIVAWISEFVMEEKGMEVIGQLLGGLVSKGGKRKSLNEVEDMILLELIKCLRVLMNTEVVAYLIR